MQQFEAKLLIIGINPYVSLSEKTLKEIFSQAGRNKGPIPVRGNINGKAYKQTLMRFKGEWRLYINTMMLKDSPKRIGETITLSVEYDPVKRTIPPHPALVEALEADKKAKAVFESLSPSRRHEIIRYIAHLRTEESVIRNIKKALDYLTGKGRFVGRDKP